MNGTAKLAKLSWLELQADSGTFAKSVGVTPKAYTHRGYDGFKAASTENFIASRTGDRANFVGIMAAQDDQPANATDSGSVLTIALQEAIGTAKKQGSKLTIESLYRDGERNVMSEVGRLRKSRPALEQQPNLFALDKGLLLYELNVGGAPDVEVTERLDPAAEDPLINEWREIADSVTERVEFTVSQNVFPIHPDPTGENSDACDFERYSGELAVDRGGRSFRWLPECHQRSGERGSRRRDVSERASAGKQGP